MNKNNLQHFQPSLGKKVDFVVNPGEYFLNEIVGQDEAIDELVSFKNMILNKNIYQYWSTLIPKGILLEGPTGTGKTISVRALANELGNGVKLIEISYKNIASRYMDAPIENLREYFSTAEKYSEECHVIIFIDEIDAMLPQRNNETHEVTNRRVNVFLEWLDGGFQSMKNITLIGSTNFKENIDKAILRPGRIDKIIHFNNLTDAAIIKGLKLYLEKKNYNEHQVGHIDWDLVASSLKSQILSGADIGAIVESIVSNKAKEHYSILQKETTGKIGHEDFNFNEIHNEKFHPSPITTETIIQGVSTYIQSRYGYLLERPYALAS